MNPTSTKRMLAVMLGSALLLPGAATAAAPAVDRTSHAASTSAEATRPGATYDVRLSKLIGMEVRDRAGQNLGKIEDVILDSNTGELHYAIVARGGVAGVDEKLFAVPLLQARADGKGHLVLARWTTVSRSPRQASYATTGQSGTTRRLVRNEISAPLPRPHPPMRASGVRAT